MSTFGQPVQARAFVMEVVDMPLLDYIGHQVGLHDKITWTWQDPWQVYRFTEGQPYWYGIENDQPVSMRSSDKPSMASGFADYGGHVPISPVIYGGGGTIVLKKVYFSVPVSYDGLTLPASFRLHLNDGAQPPQIRLNSDSPQGDGQTWLDYGDTWTQVDNLTWTRELGIPQLPVGDYVVTVSAEHGTSIGDVNYLFVDLHEPDVEPPDDDDDDDDDEPKTPVLADGRSSPLLTGLRSQHMTFW